MSTETDSPLWSRLASTLATALERSGTAKILESIRNPTRRRWQSLQSALTVAHRHSTIHRAHPWLARATRHSVTYRWLTKEPKMVVVDLQETWTLGPCIRVVEWLASTRAVRRAGASTTALARMASRPLRITPVRVASVLLLGLAVTALALGWTNSDWPARLGLLISIGVGIRGLRVDADWQEVADSRVGTALRALFEPPPSPDEGDDSP